VTSNVRELNGAYNILSSYLALSNGELDLDMAKKLLISIVSPNQKKLFTSDVIINAVSKYFDISPEKITGSGRVKEIVSARAIAMYICRELLEANYDTIGSYFGDKKHSTVIHSIKNVEDSEELLAQTKEIIKKLTE
jgi:chromosomal replication initiator protein